MVINSKNIITIICILIVLAIVLPILYFKLPEKSDIIETKNEYLLRKDILEFIRLVSRRWKYGDIEHLWGTDRFECTDIPAKPTFIEGDFLRCNGVYMRCVFTNQINSVNSTIVTQKNEFKAIANSFKIIKGGDLLIRFIELKTKKKFSLRLEHNCSDVYLPQKIYSGGPKLHDNDAIRSQVWDNINRKIFIDKSYVTHWDVHYQKLLSKPYKLKNKRKLPKFYAPVLEYSKIKMKRYCKSIGKRVLTSKVMDAASFYPTKYENGYAFKSFYPWGKERGSLGDENINLENCNRFATKECIKNFGEKIKYTSKTPSWIGAYHVLGGEVEFLPNSFLVNTNLNISSAYLSRKSKEHRLGVRSDWIDTDLKYKSGVAFRCMRIK